MSDRKATIDDVARLAGASLATVSRVLNHPEIVRPELRERVTRAVAALSYTRDGTARALKLGRTDTIGAVVPTLGMSIFAEGTEALQNRLSEHGYTLLLANSQYDPRKELQEVRALIDRGIDAIVLVGDTNSPETLTAIRQRGIPVVTTYIARSRRGVPAIGIDNEAAIGEMTRYLLGLGHREFGVIANATEANDRTRARLRGITRTLASAGIALPAGRMVNVEHSLANGRLALRQLTQAYPGLTAVICTTDTLAVGAMTEARALGIKVPQLLSVTGFDDIELSSQVEPALTTIHIPASEIARSAADHLVNALAGLPIPPSFAFPARLVIRGSTAPPPVRSS